MTPDDINGAGHKSADYLTAADLVTRWRQQVTERTLANWRVKGQGPRFVKLGGRVLYPSIEVLAWETANTHDQTVKGGR